MIESSASQNETGDRPTLPNDYFDTRHQEKVSGMISACSDCRNVPDPRSVTVAHKSIASQYQT